MLISVIIPVYNVENYLRQCLDSVISQTYKDYEVLLILGKSDDRSEQICKEYANKDRRIILYYQKDKGLGSARNIGIENAKGKYIAFLDSDDWWDPKMLAKLYSCMTINGADMVMCDRYNVYYDRQEYMVGVERLTNLSMMDSAESVIQNRDLIRNCEVSVNGKLYKRDLFIDNKIHQPNCFGEDRAVMYYLIAKCRKVSKVKEALYYYRAAGINNSVCKAETYLSTSDCMDHIYNLFLKDGLVEPYRTQLNYIFYDIANIGRYGLSTFESSASGDQIVDAKQKIEIFIKEHCSNRYDTKYIMGSYSLRHSLWMRIPIKEDRVHYCYSSIISVFSKKTDVKEDYDFSVLSDVRRKWVREDIYKDFIDSFHPKENDILMIDFLEERYNLLRFGDTFITKSDLLDEVTNDYYEDYEEIDRLSAKCEKLWKEKCLQFITFLRERISADRIVLIKSKLVNEYRVEEAYEKYENNDRISALNAMLDRYYDYFIRKFPEVTVVECPDAYLYTDHDFVFGKLPWHMNDLYYMRQSELIENSFPL